jgi:hypothetical protein
MPPLLALLKLPLQVLPHLLALQLPRHVLPPLLVYPVPPVPPIFWLHRRRRRRFKFCHLFWVCSRRRLKFCHPFGFAAAAPFGFPAATTASNSAISIAFAANPAYFPRNI